MTKQVVTCEHGVAGLRSCIETAHTCCRPVQRRPKACKGGSKMREPVSIESLARVLFVRCLYRARHKASLVASLWALCCVRCG